MKGRLKQLCFDLSFKIRILKKCILLKLIYDVLISCGQFWIHELGGTTRMAVGYICLYDVCDLDLSLVSFYSFSLSNSDGLDLDLWSGTGQCFFFL